MGEEPEKKLGFGIYSPGAGVGVGAALGVELGAAVNVVSHARQMNIKKPR